MPISGLLNINKSAGITSFRATELVRKCLAADKAGHCGTLDPAAEGVMLVLFGRSTRFQDSLLSLPKVYRARILFGLTTDSGDTTGKTTSVAEVPVNAFKDIGSILAKYTGEIEQIPPMFSALKYGGKRLYEFARSGVTVPREKRKVTVYSFDLLGIDGNSIEVRIECSRGTYIRTLATDIGGEVGCGAALQYLCRERVGPFDIASAVKIGRDLYPSRDAMLSCSIDEAQIGKIIDEAISGSGRHL